jgi:hypothetical protein
MIEQLAEPLRPKQQLPDDQQRPSLADDFGGASERAELPVMMTARGATPSQLRQVYFDITS